VTIRPTSQFGFRKNASTANATYKLINDILQALNNKMKCGGIFFELEKVFDCVDHDTLMNKINIKRSNLTTDYRNGEKLTRLNIRTTVVFYIY
jgi:hypothetical protein